MLSLPTFFTLLAAWVSMITAAPVAELEDRQFGTFPGFGTGSTGGSTTGCTAYEIISARGTTEGQATPLGNSGTVQGILRAVPGGKNYEVVYPAVADFVNGPRQGASDMLNHVQSTLAACPDTKFVLVGYSQGAMVVVTAENNNQLPANSVVASILYGNPYWAPGHSENAGTAITGFGSAAFSGLKTPSAYVSKTQDYCNALDIVCTSTGSIIAHLGYNGSGQQTKAIAFAKKQLNAAGIQ